jgi:GPH family glycoside/pentoside/hexuronide:cation symporter
MTAATLITFLGTREKNRFPGEKPKEGFFSTYKAVFLNRPFVLLLLTYALHIMGITFLQSILSYYTEYVYGRPDLTPLAMMILLLTAMVFIPVSVAVSKRIGKKRTYQICFAVIASACLIIFAAGRSLGPDFFLGLMVYAGIGVGFSYVAPFAMVPDAVDYDAVKTGERKEGAYYGMWTFVSKLGMSLSMLVSGLILDIGGYAANAEQTAGARTAIRLLMGPIPAALFLAALFCIALYSLDEDRYRKILGSKTAI